MRLEEVAKAVGGGYCRLQMPLSLALGVRETVAGHRLGALRAGTPPPVQCIPAPPNNATGAATHVRTEALRPGSAAPGRPSALCPTD